MKKVFLGGTVSSSTWREKLISMLKIDYFNPIVEDWTEECRIEELRQREICDYCLYIITQSMEGAYSIAEVVDDSNKRPNKTILCILEKDEGAFSTFSYNQLKSLYAVREIVKNNGATVFNSLEEVAFYLNFNSILYK